MYEQGNAQQAALQDYTSAVALAVSSLRGRTMPVAPLESVRECYVRGEMSLGEFEIVVEAMLRSSHRPGRP